MTETSTVEAARAQHAIAMRVIADLHAAYGKGVDMTVNTEERKDSTWLHLFAPQDSLTVGFWDDGTVFDSSDQDVADGGHLVILEHVRTFLHKHGYGAR